MSERCQKSHSCVKRVYNGIGKEKIRIIIICTVFNLSLGERITKDQCSELGDN